MSEKSQDLNVGRRKCLFSLIFQTLVRSNVRKTAKSRHSSQPMSRKSQKGNIGRNQYLQIPGKGTLVVVNVFKIAGKRRSTAPMSGNRTAKDIDRDEWLKAAASSQRTAESGISAQKMRVSLNFSNVKDTDLWGKFKGIGYKMKLNNRRFPETPVDLEDFAAMVDEYHGAIAAAMDGSKKAILQRQKLRSQATKMARQLGHYVEDVADGDLETIYAAGFDPAYKYRRLRQALPQTGIKRVLHGPSSGTALVYIIPIPRSKGKVAHYELGYAKQNGDGIGEFTIIPTTVARFPIPVENLTPGTIYLFQVRAANNIGFNGWSDPVSFMAT
jgi:fibronectin type III domain protein